jgi:hypothetical protein
MVEWRRAELLNTGVRALTLSLSCLLLLSIACDERVSEVREGALSKSDLKKIRQVSRSECGLMAALGRDSLNDWARELGADSTQLSDIAGAFARPAAQDGPEMVRALRQACLEQLRFGLEHQIPE